MSEPSGVSVDLHDRAPPAPRAVEAPERWSRVARVVLAAALVLALVQVYYYFVRVVDDAFISLRFAERLVDGLGLTYNDGAFVEGFSNPLWVFLQAGFLAIGVDGIIATKLLGLASYAGLFVALDRYGRSALGLGPLARATSLLLLAASSAVASWAMWGLETPLYLALMVSAMAAMHALVTRGTRRAGVLVVLTIVGLVATRPESPLYVVAIGAGALLDARVSSELRRRVRVMLPWAALAALIIGLLLVWRHATFGRWLPQTYYAKQGTGFDLGNLEPLVGMGASIFEVLFTVIALAGCIVAVVWRRASGPLLVVLANLFFVASVTVDWMPNQRHFLPLFVLACPLFVLALQRLFAVRALSAGGPRRVALALATALTLGHVTLAASVDSRYSIYDFRTHGRGERWILRKDTRGWNTAWTAIRRVPPAHVAGMDVRSLGMIDQVFRIFESSAADEATSWYVGRDIGIVGYLSPIQIFDTEGLFTPELTASPRWVESRAVEPALAREVFSRRPVATDLYDDWPRALAAERDLARTFEVIVGDARHPVAVRPKEVVRPTTREILARYDRAVERMRLPFFVGTLYGENVGAALEKRAAWMHETLRHLEPSLITRAEVPPGLVGAGALEDGIRALGCRVVSGLGDDAAPERVLECYFESERPTHGRWTVFVHVTSPDGERILANGDHAPCGGWCATDSWGAGVVVRDVVVLPALAEASSVRFGLFRGDERARATGAVDDDGRLVGPSLP